MSPAADGLIFLLFIPLVWVLWLWVHLSLSSPILFTRSYATRLSSPDDRVEASYRVPYLADILQFSRHGMFC